MLGLGQGACYRSSARSPEGRGGVPEMKLAESTLRQGSSICPGCLRHAHSTGDRTQGLTRFLEATLQKHKVPC